MSDSGRNPSIARDLLALAKPRITFMAVLMAWVGIWFAGGADMSTTIGTLLGTGFVVASANAINMILERDGDKLMARTANRPLPSGRISVMTASIFALVTAGASAYLLWFLANPLTFALGFGALIGYAWVYTPLKRKSSLALPIGAIPGAAPPLLGWAAAARSVDPPGLVLFAIMFLWQLPHFLAISVYLKKDYSGAGIVVVPLESSDSNAQRMALTYGLALVPMSAALYFLGVAGWLYLSVAVLTSIGFCTILFRGIRTGSEAWARPAFLASLIYLPVLMLGLFIDGVLL